MMKKNKIILILVFITGIMQAQDPTQPKAGKAPVVNLKKPQTFFFGKWLKVMVVENHKLPRVTYNLTLDNPLGGNKKKGRSI
jgi:hypothetical protein